MRLLDDLIYELASEGIDLVKDVRAYVNERRAREQQWPWTLYGAQGTVLRISGTPDEQAKCPHGSIMTTTGGQQCQLCGKFFPANP